MRLTEHFCLEEFERSSTAQARGIVNKVPEGLIPSLRVLCQEVLEPLRQHVGEPVVISSGYRCAALNKAVGGSSSSQHMRGEAADIHLADTTKLVRWFDWIKAHTRFDQLILERKPRSNHYWIHVSCRADISQNRQQVKYLVS